MSARLWLFVGVASGFAATAGGVTQQAGAADYGSSARIESAAPRAALAADREEDDEGYGLDAEAVAAFSGIGASGAAPGASVAQAGYGYPSPDLGQ